MKYTARMAKINCHNIYKKAPEILVLDAENNYDTKLSQVCKKIIEGNKSIILLTGPSSSGKTTTSIKLSNLLSGLGKKVNRVSLDNFYKHPSQMPLWDDGNKNFEIIDSLDLDCFNETMSTLMRDKKANFPIFDFSLKCRAEETFEVELRDENCFLILEGIHALHPTLSEHLDKSKIFKIYVSVHSDFLTDNDEVLLQARDLRLIRRALRDSEHRATPIESTLDMWEYVLRGENLYMHPFRETADFHINTTHYFEPGLYKELITPLLKEALKNTKYPETIERLIRSIADFGTVPKNMIPKTSLIQEFITTKSDRKTLQKRGVK